MWSAAPPHMWPVATPELRPLVTLQHQRRGFLQHLTWPVYTQSGERADFLETLERPLGPGSGRVGTGRGGPWESVWCWAGSGGLETGGRIGGDSFENKSRVGFEKIIQSDRVCLGPKSFSRVFSSHREGFRAQNKGQNKNKSRIFSGPPGGPGTTRLTVDHPE